MKHINSATIITISAIAVACSQKINPEHVQHFTKSGDTILYYNTPVAVFRNIEWEYYRGHKTMEISVERINGGADSVVDRTVDYLRTLHKNAKVEVKLPYSPEAVGE